MLHIRATSFTPLAIFPPFLLNFATIHVSGNFDLWIADKKWLVRLPKETTIFDTFERKQTVTSGRIKKRKRKKIVQDRKVFVTNIRALFLRFIYRMPSYSDYVKTILAMARGVVCLFLNDTLFLSLYFFVFFCFVCKQ